MWLRLRLLTARRRIHLRHVVDAAAAVARVREVCWDLGRRVVVRALARVRRRWRWRVSVVNALGAHVLLRVAAVRHAWVVVVGVWGWVLARAMILERERI